MTYCPDCGVDQDDSSDDNPFMPGPRLHVVADGEDWVAAARRGDGRQLSATQLAVDAFVAGHKAGALAGWREHQALVHKATTKKQGR